MGADQVGPDAKPSMASLEPGEANRTDRPDRAAPLPAGLRAVYRQVLLHFAATGAAPTMADLSEVAAVAGADPVTALRRLAELDLVAVDDSGGVVAAYPFSPTPIAHLVDVGGVRVYAMCAIDALGIPAMLDRDATIASTDPQTGQPVTVGFVAGTAVFDPNTAVVVYAATSNRGPSVDACCSTINFFTDAGSAQAWLSEHPRLNVEVLDQHAAVALGRNIFGPLLREAEPPEAGR